MVHFAWNELLEMIKYFGIDDQFNENTSISSVLPACTEQTCVFQYRVLTPHRVVIVALVAV